jgi:membrane protein implicated in regulation of membrane protease activity
MDALTTFQFAHPFWIWLALGAVLLAIEVGTGSGWLLWASASAGALALAALTPISLDGWGQVIAFSVLTISTTLLARRFWPARRDEGQDLNDARGRLVGQTGVAAGPFVNGAGRVLVEGAEWDAVAESAEIESGARVVVEKVTGGARLSVRPL